jgi:DNA-binding response OmpR family regulator
MDVLLVEDEALVREMLSEDLADAGFEVTDVPTAEAALAIAGDAEQAPSILITDVNLGPGMDGLSLVEEVRRRWPEVGVVVMTGNPTNVGERLSDPREICMLKPFDPVRLSAAVRQLMGRGRG